MEIVIIVLIIVGIMVYVELLMIFNFSCVCGRISECYGVIIGVCGKNNIFVSLLKSHYGKPENSFKIYYLLYGIYISRMIICGFINRLYVHYLPTIIYFFLLRMLGALSPHAIIHWFECSFISSSINVLRKWKMLVSSTTTYFVCLLQKNDQSQKP